MAVWGCQLLALEGLKKRRLRQLLWLLVIEGILKTHNSFHSQFSETFWAEGRTRRVWLF